MKNDGPPELDLEAAVVDRQDSSRMNTMTEKTAERAELPVEIGAGALLDGLRDLLHLRRCPGRP